MCVRINIIYILGNTHHSLVDKPILDKLDYIISSVYLKLLFTSPINYTIEPTRYREFINQFVINPIKTLLQIPTLFVNLVTLNSFRLTGRIPTTRSRLVTFRSYFVFPTERRFVLLKLIVVRSLNRKVRESEFKSRKTQSSDGRKPDFDVVVKRTESTEIYT